jgi:hypothetical protein
VGGLKMNKWQVYEILKNLNEDLSNYDENEVSAIIEQFYDCDNTKELIEGIIEFYLMLKKKGK